MGISLLNLLTLNGVNWNKFNKPIRTHIQKQDIFTHTAYFKLKSRKEWHLQGMILM